MFFWVLFVVSDKINKNEDNIMASHPVKIKINKLCVKNIGNKPLPNPTKIKVNKINHVISLKKKNFFKSKVLEKQAVKTHTLQIHKNTNICKILLVLIIKCF